MKPRKFSLLALVAVLIAIVAFSLWNRSGTEPAPSAPLADSRGESGTPPAAGAEAAEAQGAESRGVIDAVQERTELSGTAPTHAVIGRILGKSGLPVAGARVLAYRGKPGDRRGALQSLFAAMARMTPGSEPSEFGLRSDGAALSEAEVRQDGTFRLEKLHHGHLRLELDHDFYALVEPEPVFVPTDRRVVDVGPLEPYLGAMLQGRVLGPGALEGAQVQLVVEPDPMSVMREPAAFMSMMMKAGSLRVPVDGEQRFVFRAVWPSPRIEALLQSEEFHGHAGPFSLSAGEVRDIAVPTTRAAELTVLVVDPEDAPIANARVRVAHDEARGDIGRALATRRGHTGENGECTVRGLRPGRQRINASAAGFTGATAEIELGADGETYRTKLALGLGGSVRGTVVDELGVPVADAQVAHFPSMEVPILGDVMVGMGLDLIAKSALDSEFVTDAEGHFCVSGLEDPGEFHLAAIHDDFVGGLASGVHMGDEDVVIQLKEGTVVIGRAVAAETGEPLADFEVESSTTMFGLMPRPSRVAGIRNSEDGSFQLVGVPPGTFRLVVRAEGRGESSRRFDSEGGETIDAGDVELEQGAVVRGTVRDDRGGPVTGAVVRQRQGGLMDNPIVASMFGERGTRSNERGEFTLGGLSPGRLILSAHAKGFASGRSKRLRVAAGEVLTDIVIELDHGGSITGQLLLPEGMPPDEWEVVPNRGMSGGVDWVGVEADGSFRIDNLDPGRYDVQAFRMATFHAMDETQKRDWAPGKGFDIGEMMAAITEETIIQRCVVKAGETAEIVLDGRDLELQGAALEIRVLVGGEPLENGWAEITYLDGSRTITGFIKDGDLVLSRVRPGQLRVQVRGGITMTPIGDPKIVDYRADQNTVRATIDLPGGEVRGRVLDASTGEPLSSALVKLLHEDRNGAPSDDPTGLGFALTDADGAFGFRGLAEGSYSLVADNQLFRAAGEGASASRLSGVRVVGDQVVEGLVLRARPGAGVVVHVTGAAGEPLAGAMLAVVDENDRPLGSLGLTFSDSDGRAHLGGLPAGRVRVVGRGGGYAPGVSNLQEVQPGQQTEFHLRLDHGTRVRLRPIDGDGKPLVGAVVSARLADGPWIPTPLLIQGQSIDELDLGPLPRGNWEFQIVHPSTGTFSVRRTIGGGSAVTFDVSP